jgi:hypothetical protein
MMMLPRMVLKTNPIAGDPAYQPTVSERGLDVSVATGMQFQRRGGISK